MYIFRKINQKHNIRILITIGILMFYIFSSCSGDKKEYTHLSYDPEIIPSLKTDSLTMLISDSGIVRYKVIAGQQLIFDRAKDPYYFFPKGVYVEQFDSLQTILATLEADTAWNFTKQKLWKLKGHVFIKNIKDETFSLEEVFWDEKTQKIYSDKYIEINRPQKLKLKGFGFTSNQNMTDYKIFRPHDTNIYVNDSERK